MTDNKNLFINRKLKLKLYELYITNQLIEEIIFNDFFNNDVSVQIVDHDSLVQQIFLPPPRVLFHVFHH